MEARCPHVTNDTDDREGVCRTLERGFVRLRGVGRRGRRAAATAAWCERRGPDGERPQDEQLLPLVLGLLYAPSFASLVSSETYGDGAFWPIWSLPWVAILGGYCYLRYWGATASVLNEARLPTLSAR